jgi:ABC-type nitrate/sulfonate/bicarbonate transport system substrate-binding protein
MRQWTSNKGRLGLACAVIAALAAGWASGAAAEELRVFKFATIGAEPAAASELYFGLALEKGWFKEAGIDFQATRMPPPVAYPAIASGKIDGTYFAASAAIAHLRGAPLVVVYYPQYSVDWSLIVDPRKIKSPKDFAGARCVASTGAKSATHVAWAAMIDHIGGDPYAFQPVGLNQPAPFWIEALRVGTAPCMMGFDGAWASEAMREGYKMLAYLPDVKPMQTHGLAVSEATLKDPVKRKLLVDVIGVFLRSQDYVRDKSHRDEIAATVQRWMGSPKGMQRPDYEAAVDDLIKLIPPKGVVEDHQILANGFQEGLKYKIYDPKEFGQFAADTDLVKAGAIDQSVVKEAYDRGGPLYRAH